MRFQKVAYWWPKFKNSLFSKNDVPAKFKFLVAIIPICHLDVSNI